jgi:phosphatidylserine decarboxylase
LIINVLQLLSKEIQIAVVQIVSRLVPQNISFVHVDEDVRLGQRIGMIRFGSQVDLVVLKLEDIKLEVKPSEQVVAGQRVIATFKDIGEQMREVQEYSDAQSRNS